MDTATLALCSSEREVSPCDAFSIAAVRSSDYCALGEILSVEQIMEEG